MSWLSEFLHPKRAYQAGQNELDKYYNQSQGYLQPYTDNAQTQYGTLNDIIKNLTDPTELNKKWLESYTESPHAVQARGLAHESGLDAASGLGLMGSSSALDALQTGESQITLNDRQNYLNDMMNKYLQGAGIAQGLYNTGASTAAQQSQNANNMGSNSAQMQYGKNSAQGDLFSKLLGAGVGAVTNMVGGGGFGNGGWSLTGG